MQVKSILQYFRPSFLLQTVFETFALSVFEWPPKTGFTVFRLSGHTRYLFSLKAILFFFISFDVSGFALMLDCA